MRQSATRAPETTARSKAAEHAIWQPSAAWPDHRLVFVDKPLQEIVADFNRYNPSLQITVDESAGSIGQFFTGSFDAQDPESWLAVLERNPALLIEQSGGEVFIRAK